MWNWAGNKFRQRGELEILYTKGKHIGKNHSSMYLAQVRKFLRIGVVSYGTCELHRT